MGGEWDVSYRFLISKDLQSQKNNGHIFLVLAAGHSTRKDPVQSFWS